MPTPKPKKKYHFVRDTLICVVILLLLLLIGYFFLRNQISNWIDNIAQPKPAVEQVEKAPAPKPEPAPIAAPEPKPTPAPTPKPEPKQESWTYDELLLTEAITPGSRLAWISKKYYGDIAYWPYLYDANRDRLTNPSLITIGTPIRVPKLTPNQLDTTIESTRLRLEQLRSEAYEACNK